MPENHDHSKYVAVESHYEGHRRDINDLDIKAYIDERIAANSGGSSYLVYAAFITQTGASAPVSTVVANTLGGTPIWSRVEAGTYNLTLANAFPESKTILPNFIGYDGNGTTFIPITNGNASPSVIIGYYSIFSLGTNNGFQMQVVDPSGNFVELSSLITSSKLNLFIMVFP